MSGKSARRRDFVELDRHQQSSPSLVEPAVVRVAQAAAESAHRFPPAPTPAEGITPAHGVLAPAPLELKPAAKPDRAPSAARIAAVDRHNATIGSAPQRLLSRAFFNLVLGPIMRALLAVFFDVELRGREHQHLADDRGVIFALRHYYEWDPFVSWSTAFWPRALWKRSLCNYSCVGSFWTRSRLTRALAWVVSGLGLIKGQGANQSAVERYAALVEADPQSSIAIFPTGPIGRAKTYSVGTGVAYLALRCPDVAVVPVTLLGLPQVTLADLLLLRRPRLTIVLGEPFRAGSISRVNHAVSVREVCSRIGQAWLASERACLDRHPRGSGSVPSDEEVSVTGT